ncbi:hypothetical protein [Geodermatophilus maliterrae]|uniref:Uncharacterized protein n=1 Tax=Geodermatophilus maliterrae TaxID=3162531 RepID=A0ABV3XD33_9ACTN
MTGQAGRENIINVIEETFQDELGPDLISNSFRLSRRELYRLYEAHEAYIDREPELEPSPGTLRPYVPTALLPPGKYRAHLLEGTGAAFLRSIEEIDDSVSALHRLLLYCHSIALLNPLVYITDQIRLAEDALEEDHPLRLQVANYLSWISFIRPLLNSGAVVLLENRSASFSGYGRLDDVRLKEAIIEDTLAAGDFTDIEDHRDPAHVDEFTRRAPIDAAVDILSHEQAVNESYGFATDYFFPRRYFARALQALLATSGPKNDPRAESPSLFSGLLDSVRILTLSSLPLPDFEISVKDILAVRSGDEFTDWRIALGRALDKVWILSDQALLDEEAQLRIIQEELRNEMRHLESKVGRSRYLEEARRGKLSFLAGVVAALSISNWFDPTAGIVSLGARTAFERLWQLRKSRQYNAKAALMNHYLCISSAARNTEHSI